MQLYQGDKAIGQGANPLECEKSKVWRREGVGQRLQNMAEESSIEVSKSP